MVDLSRLPLSEKQARVSRFEQRINETQKNSPPTRQWVRKAIRRQGAHRCPVRLKRLSLDVIIRYGDQLADVFCKYPDDVIHAQAYEFCVGYQPPDRADRVDAVKVLTESAEWTDEWGTRWGHRTGGVGATPVDVPIQDWSQLDDFLAHRIPDPNAPGRLASVKPLLSQHGETKYCVGVIHLALFERFHCLRGMENTFVDLCTNEREVQRLCNALTDYLVELVRRWGETPVSGLYLTEDWGSQSRLMISLDMWRKYFKPADAKVVAEARKYGVKHFYFHSDGNLTPYLADLIEIGFDIFDPIQPECMNPAAVKREFGDRITLHGTISAQHTLPHGTVEEVRNEVRQRIRDCGDNGGLVIAPNNVVQPDVPLENLLAVYETAKAG